MHIDLRTDANIAAGMSPEEARRQALLQFGNPTSTRERVASADTVLSLASVWSDVRYAGRQLVKSPGFAITAVLTLAIGIGANTAIFSSMDAVVLHPISVPDLNRVVTLAEEQGRGNYNSVALANYYDWNRQNRSFEQLAVRTSADMSLTGAGDAAQVEAALTSANFFSVLRAQPLLGRVFADSECQPGHDAVAVLNYGFWQRRFAGDPIDPGPPDRARSTRIYHRRRHAARPCSIPRWPTFFCPWRQRRSRLQTAALMTIS